MEKNNDNKNAESNGLDTESTTGFFRLIWRSTTHQMCLAKMVFDGHGTPVDCIILDINPAYEEACGFTRDHAIHKRVSELFPHHAHKRIEQWGEAVRSGRKLTFVEHIDEPSRLYEVEIFPLGSRDQFIAMAQDITKQNEEKTRVESDPNAYRMENEDLIDRLELFNVLMDYNPSLIFLKDECGRYVYLNKTYEQQFVGSKNWYGKTDFDFWSKESAEQFRANDLAVLKSERVTQYLEDSKDLDGIRHCWLNYKFPYTDSKNRRYSGGIGIDVTQRILAEEALRRAEEELKHYAQELKTKEEEALELIDGFTEGSWIVDLQAGTINCSGKWSKRIGLDRVPEKERLRYAYTLVHGEDTVDGNSIEHYMETGSTRFDLEYRVKTVDSGYVWTQNKGKIVYNAKGTAIKVFAATIDITERKRAEESLAASEAKYRAIVENAGEGILISSTDGSTAFVNQRMTDMLGYDVDEMLGRPAVDFTFADWEHRVYEATVEVHESGAMEGEFKLRRKDGSPLWTHFTGVCLYDERGRHVANMALHTDITERMRAEEALRESEERFHVIQELSPDGFTILRPVCDAKGQIADFIWLYENAAIAKLNGTDPQKVIGHRLLDVFPGHRGSTILESYIHVAETGNPCIFEAEYGLESMTKPTWFRLAVIRMNEDIAILSQDITISKKTEEEIKKTNIELARRTSEILEERQRFFAVLETLPVMICLITPDYHIPFSNKAFREKFGEADGRHCYEYCCGFSEPCAFCESLNPLKTGQPHHWEFTSPDGSMITDAYNFPFRDTDGSPLILEMNIDITERKRSELALRSSDAWLAGQKEAFQAAVGGVPIEISIGILARSAIEHMGADVRCAFYATDYTKGRLRLVTGMPESYGECLESLEIGADSLANGLAAYTGQPVIAPDVMQDPRWRNWLWLAERYEYRGAWSFPIETVSGNVVGTFAMYFKSPREATPKDYEFAEHLTRAAAIIISQNNETKEKARAVQLLKESERAALELVQELQTVKAELTEEVEALLKLNKISKLVLSQHDAEYVSNDILETAIDLTHADKGNIQIFNEKANTRKFLAQKGFKKPFLDYFDHSPMHTAACGRAFQERKPIMVEDVRNDPIFKDTPDMHYMLEEGLYACQSTPMISSAGNIIGILSTHYTTPHVFSEREIRMLEILSRWAADIIEISLVQATLQESERKALALVKELEEADKNKNQFIGVLSHELRNPLAAIVSGLSILEVSADQKKNEKAKEIMRRQSNQLCKLVDDLLDLTRITQNKIKINRETIDLQEIVHHCVEDMMPAFKGKGLQLNEKLNTQPILLSADPARITQCVGILLHNALKFTPEKGIVRISLAKEKEQAVIRVEDDGIGISPETLPQLFKPFAQADHSLSRHKNGGLGLGLTIVKSVIEMHNGKVTASSKGVGEGALFTISLPIKSHP